jgi:hypothetical protein
MDRDSGYSRAYTRVLTSTLFDVLDYVSPDDHEWTQGLLKNYGKIEDKGPEGSLSTSLFLCVSSKKRYEQAMCQSSLPLQRISCSG